MRTRYGTVYGWAERPVVPEGVTVPTILPYSPYAAVSSPVPGEELGNLDESYVPRGYARAYFHLVGMANSGGCYDYGSVRSGREVRLRVGQPLLLDVGFNQVPVPEMLRMGQQGHGSADFGHGQRIRHAWFDHWLLGRRTGVRGLPIVDSKTNTGQRFTSAQWPPAGTTVEALTLSRRPGDAALALAPARARRECR